SWRACARGRRYCPGVLADRTSRRALGRAASYGVAASVPVLALGWLVRAESGAVAEADRATVAAATRFTAARPALRRALLVGQDRKSTRLNSSHVKISYAVFCLKKKKKQAN